MKRISEIAFGVVIIIIIGLITKSKLNGEDALVLTDEVYLCEREYDSDARTGGKVEIHYPQIISDRKIDKQINFIIRDTAFSRFDGLSELTYEEAIEYINQEQKNRTLNVMIEYEVLQYTNSYISIIFSADVSDAYRVNIDQYLATIDLNTMQYIHFCDLMNIEDLSRILRNNHFEILEGTTAFFKEEDAHESEKIEEFILEIEDDINTIDWNQFNGDEIEHTLNNPHYCAHSFQNIGLDDNYIYIRFYDFEYALNEYFIFRIPLEYTNINL